MRRALAGDIGIVLPGVRLRDDLTRDPETYAIRVRDELAGEGRLKLDALLAVGDEAVLAPIDGERVREPVYGMPAVWIGEEQRERALQSGALVFDPISIIGSHLAEVAREHAEALLGRQELQTMLEHLRATVPALVKEIGSDVLPLATVHKTFELLLRERVWPRDVVATLQAIVEASAATRDPRDLAAAVRRAIVPAQLRRRGIGHLEPLILTPELDAELVAAWSSEGSTPARPQTAMHVRHNAAEYAASVRRDRAAVVCTAALRPMLGDFLHRFGIALDVFAYAELPPEMELRPAGVLTQPAAAA